MKKTPKTSPKSNTRPRNDKRLDADKLAAVTGGWGLGGGTGI